MLQCRVGRGRKDEWFWEGDGESEGGEGKGERENRIGKWQDWKMKETKEENKGEVLGNVKMEGGQLLHHCQTLLISCEALVQNNK